MSKKSRSFKFWLGGGGGCSMAVHPFGAPLWLSPVITASHMHIQYDQLTTEPALGIHMKNLYCTITCHVMELTSNWQPRLTSASKSIKNWIYCSETVKPAGWMVSSSSSCVCWLLVLAMSCLSYFHADTGHMHNKQATTVTANFDNTQHI